MDYTNICIIKRPLRDELKLMEEFVNPAPYALQQETYEGNSTVLRVLKPSELTGQEYPTAPDSSVVSDEQDPTIPCITEQTYPGGYDERDANEATTELVTVYSKPDVTTAGATKPAKVIRRDPDAVREALRQRGCPFRPAEEIRDALSIATQAEVEHPGSIAALAAEQKPEIYGDFAEYIEEPLKRLEATENDDGLVQLYWNGDGTEPVVMPNDIDNWNDLMDVWLSTLDTHVSGYISSKADSEEWKSLEALWETRQAGSGDAATPRDAKTHIRGGITTATTSITTTAYGINEYLKELGHSREERIDFLKKSPSPVMQQTELSPGQIDPFLIKYNGMKINGKNPNEITITIDYDDIETDIYEQLPNGAVKLKVHPADLPLSNGARIGEIPTAFKGPRIACPIRLTPQLTQKLWCMYIDTAAAAKLI
jgi:hypothetical protein